MSLLSQLFKTDISEANFIINEKRLPSLYLTHETIIPGKIIGDLVPVYHQIIDLNYDEFVEQMEGIENPAHRKAFIELFHETGLDDEKVFDDLIKKVKFNRKLDDKELSQLDVINKVIGGSTAVEEMILPRSKAIWFYVSPSKEIARKYIDRAKGADHGILILKLTSKNIKDFKNTMGANRIKVYKYDPMVGRKNIIIPIDKIFDETYYDEALAGKEPPQIGIFGIIPESDYKKFEVKEI